MVTVVFNFAFSLYQCFLLTDKAQLDCVEDRQSEKRSEILCRLANSATLFKPKPTRNLAGAGVAVSQSPANRCLWNLLNRVHATILCQADEAKRKII
jgi:hypothetical protein